MSNVRNGNKDIIHIEIYDNASGNMFITAMSQIHIDLYLINNSLWCNARHFSVQMPGIRSYSLLSSISSCFIFFHFFLRGCVFVCFVDVFFLLLLLHAPLPSYVGVGIYAQAFIQFSQCSHSHTLHST